MSKFSIYSFAPFDESCASETTVGFGDVSFDKFVGCFSDFTLREQWIAPISISSFAIRIDLNCTREPFTSLYLFGALVINVSNEKRCFVELWIEQQRTLVHLDCLRKLSFAECGFSFTHRLVNFFSSWKGFIGAAVCRNTLNQDIQGIRWTEFHCLN